MDNPKDPYSVHHFLFPFRWDVLENFSENDVKENVAFDKRTCMKSFHQLLCPSGGCLWQRKPYRKEAEGKFDAFSYNEFTYFHDFVRKVIYDYEPIYGKGLMQYYEYNIDKEKHNFYKIKWRERKRKEVEEDNPALGCVYEITGTDEYTLELKGISLHIFNTGIGILAYNLENDRYDDPEKIKRINEYGRRIYPQFVGSEGIENPKDAFLADKISLLVEGRDILEEDFNNYTSDVSVQKPFAAPKHIINLFPSSFCFNVKNRIENKFVLIGRVMDDRMFFICWHGSHFLSRRLGKQNCYKTNDWWYSYMFGDKGWKSIANDEIQKAHTEKHTYPRWVNYGTIFGITRDSFVSVSDTPTNLTNHGAPRLNDHMNSMYYQMVVLCLAQRACILKFSAEVANLAEIEMEQSSDLLQKLKDLHRNYLEFTNKIYFREVTSQIQGIELYEQLQRIMNIPNDVADLDKEIGALFNYVRLEEEEKQTLEAAEQTRKATKLGEEANTFTRWGIPFIIMSFVASLMGINAFSEADFSFLRKGIDWFRTTGSITALILIVISGYFSFKAVEKFQQKK